MFVVVIGGVLDELLSLKPRDGFFEVVRIFVAGKGLKTTLKMCKIIVC